ncbi:MAG: glycerol-3-phosphate 1-O-acyltransferase PlsY [Candidatus Omnitrophota bacterium]
MMVVLGIIIAYLLGSIPTSYLMGKIFGLDVRKHGSGNVGATNVLRVLGKLPAAITLIADIGKGVLAVTVLASVFYKKGAVSFDLFRALLGMAVIAGHNWTIFLNFKGGKGVATFIGVFAVLLPVELITGLLVWIATVWITKYVSLGSIFLAISVPLIAAFSGKGIDIVILAITACIIICYKHKGNIDRLILGTERKVGEKS